MAAEGRKESCGLHGVGVEATISTLCPLYYSVNASKSCNKLHGVCTGEPVARPLLLLDISGDSQSRPYRPSLCGRYLLLPGFRLEQLNDVEEGAGWVVQVGKMAGAGRFRLGDDDRPARRLSLLN